MSTKKQYRLRMDDRAKWGEWRNYSGGAVYVQGVRYIEYREVREYIKDMILLANDGYILKYRIVSDEIVTEKDGGRERQLLACEALYEDGDNSFCFIIKEKLDSYDVEGE